MDILSEFPGDFFKAQELVGKQLSVTIVEVTKEEMSDGRVKPVLRFAEDHRGLVLNVENRTTLVDRFGRDTTAWAGKKITLITRRVQGPNGPCHGIRLADAPVCQQIDDEINDQLPLALTAPAAKKKRAFT